MMDWAGKNPIKAVFLAIFLSGFVFAGFKILGAAGNFASQAVDVAAKEFAPAAMLRKYEYFKEASQGLLEMEANIVGYKTRIDDMKADYAGASRMDWDRFDKQQLNTWRSELVGVKQIYNGIAAEYNAQSNKFNWELFDATDGDVIVKSFKQY